MTHVVHPYSHRLGIIRDWKSRWFGSKKVYVDNLRSDILLTEYLKKRLKGFYIASIEVERNEKKFRIIIKTSRPGMVIGRNGDGAVKLRKDVENKAKQLKIKADNLKIDIEEVRYPEGNATIVAFMIVEGLEKRMPFRRVIKQIVEKVMASRDVKGVRIVVAGRLGGTEMARKESVKRGSIPLQTFRADIDYASEQAHMPYGLIGVKVWINKGEVFDKDKTGKVIRRK